LISSSLSPSLPKIWISFSPSLIFSPPPKTIPSSTSSFCASSVLLQKIPCSLISSSLSLSLPKFWISFYPSSIFSPLLKTIPSSTSFCVFLGSSSSESFLDFFLDFAFSSFSGCDFPLEFFWTFCVPWFQKLFPFSICVFSCLHCLMSDLYLFSLSWFVFLAFQVLFWLSSFPFWSQLWYFSVFLPIQPVVLSFFFSFFAFSLCIFRSKASRTAVTLWVNSLAVGQAVTGYLSGGAVSV